MISALSLGEEAGDTVISLQPGGKGRAWELSPTGCHSVVDFQEAFSPWLGPLGGAGLPAGRAVPTSSRLGPQPHKGEDCSHRGAWARKHKWPLCVCSRGCGLRPAAEGWVRAPPSFAGPQPCLSRWERRTSECTDSRLFFMLVTSHGSPVHLDHP